MSDVARMTKTLHEVAALPEADARCLPGAFYTDPDFFRFEVDSFLSRQWHCLGRVDEIPETGDYFTAQLFDEPLLVVRGEAGEIRVMSNVCRHRGMMLADGSGRARRFVCPYHAWCYDLSGGLQTAPYMQDRDINADNCRLPTFRSEVWNGFIYANLDDDAQPLAPQLGRLDALLKHYEPENMRIVRSFEEEWRTNWKCLVENFMEAYHLSVVHPKTLRPYTPTGLSRKSLSDDAFTSYVANYPEKAAPRGQGSSALTDEERRRSTLFCVFPGQVASQAATLLVSFSIQPVAVDRIRVRWTLSTFGTEMSEDELEQRIALWHEVNREDREKLERMQTALASRHAPSGLLGPVDFEGTIRDFYRYLSRCISPAAPTLVAAAD